MKTWRVLLIILFVISPMMLWLFVRYIEYRNVRLGVPLNSQKFASDDYQARWRGEIKVLSKIGGGYLLMIVTDVVPENTNNSVLLKSFDVFAFGCSILHTSELAR